jgi:hypothetical protein
MRPIPGYDGLYSVTEDGRVYSHRAGRFIGGYPAKGGYINAVLTLKYKRWCIGVHHLVALAYLGDHRDGFEVNHKNGDPSDNRLANLEWVTHRENCSIAKALHLMRTRQRGERNGAAKFSQAQVEEVRRLRAVGMTQQSIANSTGISQPHVSRILRGENWAHTA